MTYRGRVSLPPPPLPSRPLRRDARRNRQRILEAGRELVVEHGLNVSHEQIAEAADVAVGTVYRHFPDRELLVEELLTGHVDAVVARAEAAAQIEDPWEALVSFMVTGLEIRVANRGLHEIFLGTTRGARLATHSRERIAPLAARIVDRCHRAGVLRPGVGALDLAVVPIMIGALGTSARHASPELWKRHLVAILDGFRYDGGALPGSTPTPGQIDQILSSWRPPRA